MVRSKEDMLQPLSEQYNWTDREQQRIEEMMDEWGEIKSKEVAIGFIEYNERFRREEGVWFKKECDKLGGMFSLADYGVENIYNDYIAKKPIRSYIISDKETFWVFNDKGKLVHSSTSIKKEK